MSPTYKKYQKHFWSVRVLPPHDSVLDISSKTIHESMLRFHDHMVKIGYHLPSVQFD